VKKISKENWIAYNLIILQFLLMKNYQEYH